MLPAAGLAPKPGRQASAQPPCAAASPPLELSVLEGPAATTAGAAAPAPVALIPADVSGGSHLERSRCGLGAPGRRAAVAAVVGGADAGGAPGAGRGGGVSVVWVDGWSCLISRPEASSGAVLCCKGSCEGHRRPYHHAWRGWGVSRGRRRRSVRGPSVLTARARHRCQSGRAHEDRGTALLCAVAAPALLRGRGVKRPEAIHKPNS